jgi:hypothetical protein
MGKILDAITGKNKKPSQPASPGPQVADDTQDGPIDFRFLKPLAFALAVLLFCAVVAFAAYSVIELFQMRLGATLVEAALATLSSVGVCVGVLFIVLTSTHAPLRGLGAIVLIAWSFLVLALVALNSALRGGLLTVPDGLTSVGRLVAALLAGVALVPAITLPLAAHDKSDYASASAASSKYLGFIAKGVGVAVSAAASVYFGLSRNINPLVAGLAGFVLESCFLWSYLMLIRATQRRDMFDMWLWRIATIAFGLFLAAVSVETISTLAEIDVPIVSALGEVGATLYVSAVGLSLILTIAAHVITSLVDIPADAPARVMRPANAAPLSTRIAGRINGTRAGVGEIRQALRGEQSAPQLTAGTTLADEGVKEAGDGWAIERFANPERALYKRKRGGLHLTVYDWPTPHWSVFDPRRKTELVASGKSETVDDAKAAALASEHKPEAARLSENGTPYDATGEVSDAPAQGWPVPQDLESIPKP